MLTGFLPDGQEVDINKEITFTDLKASVKGNLSRLFGTRQGTIEHIPDYGLPDISAVYRDDSDTVEDFRGKIELAVSTYELRLKNVKVVEDKDNHKNFRLTFIVKAFLEGHLVKYGATFTSMELPQVDLIS